MSAKAGSCNGLRLYSPEIFTLSFECYTKSKSLYNQLREDFKLPSLHENIAKSYITTLKTKQFNILTNLFHYLDKKNKVCALLHDEIYIRRRWCIMEVEFLVNLIPIHLYWRKQCLASWLIFTNHENMIPCND